MTKVGVVMRREFLATVRRRSYLIVTFGMPFFASLYFGLFALVPAWFMARGGASDKDVGLVDLAGVVRMEEAGAATTPGSPGPAGGAGRLEGGRLLPEGWETTGGGRIAGSLLRQATTPVRFRLFADRQEAMTALREQRIERLFVIPAAYLTSGGVEIYQSEEADVGFGRRRAREALEGLLERSLTAGRLPDEVRRRLRRPIEGGAVRSFVMQDDGTVTPLDATSRVARLAIPGVFGFLLLMSLMTGAGYLLQGVSEEKENRVIEVILASVRPEQLLFGKLLGLGAAGLLQLAVWIGVASLSTGLLAAAALAALNVRLFLGCLIFFVLGFLMIGSLMTGTGALGTSARESQQLAAIWSLITVLPPALTWMVLMDQPNGLVARLLGWFPLTAPITMMIRMGTGRVPLWDVGVAILTLSAGVWLAVRVSAALFRLGLLLYGTRPGLRQIVRHLRRA